ncbi:MAG: hypothetical protein FWD58_07540 [Firmicutes bacterium]|nr:hypothetical protein [Bacillota bacterium]
MYTYLNLLDEIDFLCRCGGAKTGSIGISADGRPIPYIYVGNSAGPQIIVTAGIHAREHIGSYLAVRQAAHFLTKNEKRKTKNVGGKAGQLNVGGGPSGAPHHKSCVGSGGSPGTATPTGESVTESRILNPESHSPGGIYFIPMCNPDGNTLIAKGLCGIRSAELRQPLCEILKNKNRALFKANARGVDLNVNFDAGWGTGRQNTREAGCENYIGPHPFSEPETKALRDFTLAVCPAATVSYHCIGRELYWEFGQSGDTRARDLAIAKFLNERLGYKIAPDDGTSAGGYKDWCIEALGIPSFTIELVSDEHTHPFTDYRLAKYDIERNLDLPERLLGTMIS